MTHPKFIDYMIKGYLDSVNAGCWALEDINYDKLDDFFYAQLTAVDCSECEIYDILQEFFSRERLEQIVDQALGIWRANYMKSRESKLLAA